MFDETSSSGHEDVVPTGRPFRLPDGADASRFADQLAANDPGANMLKDLWKRNGSLINQAIDQLMSDYELLWNDVLPPGAMAEAIMPMRLGIVERVSKQIDSMKLTTFELPSIIENCVLLELTVLLEAKLALYAASTTTRHDVLEILQGKKARLPASSRRFTA